MSDINGKVLSDEKPSLFEVIANLDEGRAEEYGERHGMGAAECLKLEGKREFLIGPSLLPVGGRALITAATGVGKSTFALHIAACLATGSPLFDLRHKHKGEAFGEPVYPVLRPSRVLYVDYELDHAVRAEKRLRPMAAHFERELFEKNLYFARHPTRYRLQGEGLVRLAKLTKSLNAKVLIVDPLSSSHTAQENTSDMKQVLQSMDELMAACGCAGVLVHHASSKKTREGGKIVERDAIEEARGHSSLVDWPDLMFTLKASKLAEEGEESDKPDIVQMIFGKVRHNRKPKRRFFSVDRRDMVISPLSGFDDIKFGEK